MKNFKQFIEERRIMRALKNLVHKLKNPRKFTPIENPIRVFHGGTKKRDFNHKPTERGADGVGHYVLADYDKAVDYARETKNGHVHTIDMHLHRSNMMDMEKKHHEQTPAIKRKLNKVFKKHGFKPNKNNLNMQDTLYQLGRHINKNNGQDGRAFSGHEQAAEDLHDHGIHAGYGEYLHPNNTTSTSYCVFGKSRNQLDVKDARKSIWQ